MIPFVDLKSQYHSIKDEIDRAVAGVLESTAFVLGKEVAAFENDLKRHAVKVLIYNNQATEELTKRLQTLATQNRIPVVGVSETEPPGVTYQDWMTRTLDALDKALGGGNS